MEKFDMVTGKEGIAPPVLTLPILLDYDNVFKFLKIRLPYEYAGLN